MVNRRQFLQTVLGGASVASRLLEAGKGIPDLKITGMKVHLVSKPLKEPMGYCCAPGAVLGMKSTGGRWLANFYDPDGTRTELMIRKPVETPCCTELKDPYILR